MTQEEELRRRRSDVATRQGKAVVGVMACGVCAALFALLFAHDFWGGAEVAKLLRDLGCVVLATFAGRYGIGRILAARREDVTSPAAELPRVTDLPPRDPRNRYPRWLRLTVLVFELPLCLGTLPVAVIGLAVLFDELERSPGLGALCGFVVFLAVRIGYAHLRHELTGE